MGRGLTHISRAGNPKRPLPNCQAGPTASSTPLLFDAQMPWGGHPLCGRPAGYLPPGTVGQWPPATLQWRTVHKGGDPKTDQEGTTRTPGWHPEENEAQLPPNGVLSNQRGGPKTLERAVNIIVSSLNDDITHASDVLIVGKRESVSLSVDLVVVCCLLYVAPPGPCRRAVKVSRSRSSCLSLDHMMNLKNITLDGNTGHFDKEIDLAGQRAWTSRGSFRSLGSAFAATAQHLTWRIDSALGSEFKS